MLEYAVGGGFLMLLMLAVLALMPGIDGFGGFGGGNNGAGGGAGASGAVPGGGAGTSGAGAPGVSVPPPPPPAPSPQPTPQPAPQPQPGPTPQPVPQPGVQGGVPQPAPQPANPLASLPPQMLAQVQAWQRAAAEWERNRHFAKLGYEAYLRANNGGGGGNPQPQPGPAPGPQKTNPFGVPTFDLRQLSLIRRNPETGQYEQDQSAPPGFLQTAQQYQEKLLEAQHGFFQDPEKFLAPIIEQIAGRVAEQRAQQQYQQVEQQQFARQQLDPAGPNASWLYQKDAAGNVVYGWNPQTGQQTPQLGPWGQEYARRVAYLQQNGVVDGRQQHELAVQYLQNLAFQQVYQQQQQQAAGAAAGQNFLGNAAAGGVPGTQPAPQPNPNPAPSPAPIGGRNSLRHELDKLYTQHGYTDDRINQAVMNGVGAA